MKEFATKENIGFSPGWFLTAREEPASRLIRTDSGGA